jgi:site-specific recombinase XerD
MTSTMTEMLTVYRRHTEACPHADQGRAWLKCKCPLWVDGILGGREMRRSLKTRNLQRAYADAERLEGQKQSQPKPIAELLNQWLATMAERAPETRKKYKRVAALLGDFCRARGVTVADQIGIEDIDAYPRWRECAAITLRKELETIKAILAWAMERGWVTKQPVKRSHMPKEVPAREIRPYTRPEIIDILAACDRIGQSAYERQRAKAALLLMRYYALRISDVASFRRDAIAGGYVKLRARKNGIDIMLPLYPDMAAALDRLPRPEGAAESPYYFWTGTSDLMSVKKGIWRTLNSVFRLSKVKAAHPHRFRHTLATEILVAGGTIEDVANILGDSPEIVRKHYMKWTPEYQERTIRVLDAVHRGTSEVQEGFGGWKSMKTDAEKVVAREGVGLFAPSETKGLADSKSPQKPLNQPKQGAGYKRGTN